MTTHQYLSAIQRNVVTTTFLAWVAGVVVMAKQRPDVALAVCCVSMAVMLGAFLYLYRSARCQRCGESLWLRMHRIAPVQRARGSRHPEARVAGHAARMGRLAGQSPRAGVAHVG
jgi:hypothetical protein